MAKVLATRTTWSESIKTIQEADNRNVKKEDPEGVQIVSCHPV